MITNLLAILGICYLFWLYIGMVREMHQEKLWAKADAERELMFKKYLQLAEDPTMTDQKWAAWLPVFIYADQVYAQHNYMNVPVNRLSDFIRQRIDDDHFLQGA